MLDSQYWQMRLQSEYYHKMRELGVFVNAPDVYFQQGSNKALKDPSSTACVCIPEVFPCCSSCSTRT